MTALIPKWQPHPRYDHLHESVSHYIELSPSERAKHAANPKGFWVPSAQSSLAMKELDWRLSLPRSTRLPNIIFSANSGAGKSTLLASHQRLCEMIELPDSVVRVPAHQIFDLTLVTSADAFLRMIARQIHCPLPRKSDPLTLAEDLASYGNRMKSVLWSFDEIQSILSLPPKISVLVVQAIKKLANSVKFPLAAAGSRDADSVFNDEEHMRQRFRTFRIEPWSWATEENKKEFHGWYWSFVSRLPLKERSAIFAASYMSEVISRTRGNTENIALGIRRSAAEALLEGKEKIDPTRLLALL